jgi:hypothetical protein
MLGLLKPLAGWTERQSGLSISIVALAITLARMSRAR